MSHWVGVMQREGDGRNFTDWHCLPISSMPFTSSPFGLDHSQGNCSVPNVRDVCDRASTVRHPLPCLNSKHGHAYGVFQPLVRVSQDWWFFVQSRTVISSAYSGVRVMSTPHRPLFTSLSMHCISCKWLPTLFRVRFIAPAPLPPARHTPQPA